MNERERRSTAANSGKQRGYLVSDVTDETSKEKGSRVFNHLSAWTPGAGPSLYAPSTLLLSTKRITVLIPLDSAGNGMWCVMAEITDERACCGDCTACELEDDGEEGLLRLFLLQHAIIHKTTLTDSARRHCNQIGGELM